MSQPEEEATSSSAEVRTTETQVEASLHHISENANERARSSFSQAANELRQRNVTTATKPEELPTTTTTQSMLGSNFKDDLYYNGGGFYECNIW